MENKNQGNEKQIVLGDFNCTKEKMEKDYGKKYRLYRSRFNYGLSKLIADNGLEDPRRRENLDSSEFTRYDRSSGTRKGKTGSILI